MTTDLVEKCARAVWVAIDGARDSDSAWAEIWRAPEASFPYREATLAVIDALADGVSDEMVRAGDEAFAGLLIPVDSELKAFLAAAIRAAKSREG